MRRPTHGGQLAEVAGLLGWELFPWQRHVGDVALEYDGRSKARSYRTVGVGVGRQNGKGLAEWTRLPTPSGWVTMGDVRVGDVLFDEAGHTCRVTFVSERRLLDCYRVTFSDGTSVVADGDHLWSVLPRRAAEFVTIATRDLDPNAATSHYRLPDAGPLDCADADLPVDPWLFGAWLGDGHSRGSCMTIGGSELDEMVALIEGTGATVKSRWLDKRCDAWKVGFTIDAAMRDGFQSRMMRLGVWGNKHIPAAYLRASTAQRVALLQGLMDTDGSVRVNGTNRTSRQCEFSVVSERLASDVLELVRSLGIRVTMKASDATIAGRVVGTRYRVMFTTALPVFRLTRKAQVLAAIGERRPMRRTIRSIEPVPSEPTRCIQVDSPSSLFRCGDGMVPTHNTTLVCARVALQLVMPGSTVVYTAQDRNLARFKWAEHVDLLLSSKAFASKVAHVDRANGRECLRMLNGSRYLIVTPGPKAGRSLSSDLIVIDEAFAQPDMALVGSLGGTMAARRNSQMWVLSNAGTWRSGLWRHYTDTGRASLDDPRSPLGWFEYAAADDCAVDDPAGWLDANPSLDLPGGVSSSYLRDTCMTYDEASFRREHLNQWADETSIQGIDPVAWAALASPLRPDDRLSLSLSFTPERDSGGVVVCGEVDGREVIEVIEHGGDIQHLVSTAIEVAVANDASVVIDRGDPAASTVHAFERAGVTVKLIARPEYARACGDMHDAIVGASVAHGSDYRLTDAVAAAAKQRVGDVWVWQRRGAADITLLVAATNARWGVVSDVAPTPMVH